MSSQLTDSATKASMNNFNRQVGLYSLAAAVAGVSMLALAEPAVGEVVVTKKTIPIPMAPHDMPEPVRISMANNGINNLSFNLSNSAPGNFRDLLVDGVSVNDGVITGSGFDPYASALTRGAKIGGSPNSFFNNYTDLVELSATANSTAGGSFRYCKGHWGSNLNGYIGCGNPKNKYLGVRFQLNGETHYGWIRLSVTTSPQKGGPLMTAKITAYAYETVANKPILAGTAGQSAGKAQAKNNIESQGVPSLGMLALGAEALPLWRRE